jgi:hypothetical protein
MMAATHVAMNAAHIATTMPLSALYVPDEDDTPSTLNSRPMRNTKLVTNSVCTTPRRVKPTFFA